MDIMGTLEAIMELEVRLAFVFVVGLNGLV